MNRLKEDTEITDKITKKNNKLPSELKSEDNGLLLRDTTGS